MTEEIFVRRASGLVRELEWYDVMIWSIACPAASGMTYYAAKMLGDPSAYGGNVAFAFFLAGLMWLPLIVAFAMISSSFPRASSLYVFVSRTIHPVLGYIPFWYWIIGGGAAMVSGFILFIGVKALAGAWAIAGILSGSKWLMDIAYVVTDPWYQFGIAIILTIILWALNYFGIRVLKWTLRIITCIPLAITIAVLVGLAIAGPNAAFTNWDKIYGAGTSANIIKAAFEGGEWFGTSVEPLSAVSFWEGTYAMLLWTLWAWTGFESVTFVGSEVKSPTKSYIRGYIGAFITIMALYLANGFLIPFVGNYDFIAAYSYLKMNYPDVLSEIVHGLPVADASVPLVASAAFFNPIIAVLIGIAYFLWYFNTAMVCWIGGVRGFFSLSFDRALPEKLAEVSPKWAAPTWANHLTFILAILGVFFTLGDSLGSELASGIVAFMDFSCLIFVWPVGLALMLLPWWKPELFKAMIIPSKIASLIIGALVFAIGWYFMIFTAYTDIPVLLTNIIVGTVGVLILAFMMAKNRARGIPVEKIYSEIPPA
ncbi:MAG: APC family permease [Candidatus Methanomethylicia archaeon]